MGFHSFFPVQTVKILISDRSTWVFPMWVFAFNTFCRITSMCGRKNTNYHHFSDVTLLDNSLTILKHPCTHNPCLHSSIN